MTVVDAVMRLQFLEPAFLLDGHVRCVVTTCLLQVACSCCNFFAVFLSIGK